MNAALSKVSQDQCCCVLLVLNAEEDELMVINRVLQLRRWNCLVMSYEMFSLCIAIETQIGLLMILANMI
jgi:hypothetical protein